MLPVDLHLSLFHINRLSPLLFGCLLATRHCRDHLFGRDHLELLRSKEEPGGHLVEQAFGGNNRRVHQGALPPRLHHLRPTRHAPV